jgi:hypothetical protein
MLRTIVGSVLLVAVLAFAAYAVDPASTPPDEPEPVRTRQEGDMMDASQSQPGASAPFPRQFVMGKVTDLRGAGMAGTGVKLFADGEIIESALTNSSGDFELDLPLNIETDETVVLWFVPSTDRYVMQSVVVKQSTVARQSGLFSRCANQVTMQPQMRVDVSLMTEDEAVASVKAKDCF